VIFSSNGKLESEVINLAKLEIALVVLPGAAILRPKGEQHPVEVPFSEVTSWADAREGRQRRGKAICCQQLYCSCGIRR
jgi:hypothetical protein